MGRNTQRFGNIFANQKKNREATADMYNTLAERLPADVSVAYLRKHEPTLYYRLHNHFSNDLFELQKLAQERKAASKD